MATMMKLPRSKPIMIRCCWANHPLVSARAGAGAASAGAGSGGTTRSFTTMRATTTMNRTSYGSNRTLSSHRFVGSCVNRNSMYMNSNAFPIGESRWHGCDHPTTSTGTTTISIHLYRFYSSSSSLFQSGIRRTGTVTFYDYKKHFGFIRADPLTTSSDEEGDVEQTGEEGSQEPAEEEDEMNDDDEELQQQSEPGEGSEFFFLHSSDITVDEGYKGKIRPTLIKGERVSFTSIIEDGEENSPDGEVVEDNNENEDENAPDGEEDADDDGETDESTVSSYHQGNIQYPRAYDIRFENGKLVPLLRHFFYRDKVVLIKRSLGAKMFALIQDRSLSEQDRLVRLEEVMAEGRLSLLRVESTMREAGVTPSDLAGLDEIPRRGLKRARRRST